MHDAAVAVLPLPPNILSDTLAGMLSIPRGTLNNLHEKKPYLVGPDKLSDPWTALFRAY